MGSRAPEEAITRRRAVADQARRVLNKVPQPHGDRGQRYLVGQLVGMIEMAEGCLRAREPAKADGERRA